MTRNEKEALITYLEFNLVKHCESIERNIDPDYIGSMYNSAYDILTEMERSIQEIIDFGDSAKKTTTKHSWLKMYVIV